MITLDLLIKKNKKKKKLHQIFHFIHQSLINLILILFHKRLNQHGFPQKGKKTIIFENLLGKYFKTKYAVATNSGTSALF